MTRLPSASQLQLAQTCPGSQAVGKVQTSWEAGTRGTELGLYLDRRVQGVSQADALAQLDAQLHDSAKDLEPCVPVLEGYATEAAYAWNVDTGAARYLGHHLGREYDTTPEEFAGAADFASADDHGRIIVVDLKCGHGAVPPPDRNMQIRFLAYAMSLVTGADEATVGLILAPEDAEPRWQWAELGPFDLALVGEELRDIARRVRGARDAVTKGQLPSLVVGEHCRYCKGRWTCPAQTAMAKRIAGHPDGIIADIELLLTVEAAGLAYARAKAFKHLLDEVFRAIYARARETPIPLGDGRVLGPKESRREELDGAVVYECAKVLFGADVALKCVTLGATKTGIQRTLRELPGPMTEKLESLLQAVRAAGGSRVNTSESIKEMELKAAD